ncbi:hypothetical protein ACFWPK_28700 [Nocardia sp. NPDC058519]|uniref:hypothetical protein n=1 Tax=unclassified Nocardia TaxID=2637762 RepID=UPI0036654641
MALGDIVYEELPKALTDTARVHAHRAIDNIGSTESLDLLDQAVSIGVSAELLLKATLASVDFGLLRDRNADHKTTLTLAGKPLDPTSPLPELKSVGAREAYRLLKQDLAPKLTVSSLKSAKPDLLDRLLAVRDSAVHMGFACQEANESALADLVGVIEMLLKIRVELGQASDWESFWTDKYRERADGILLSRHAEIATAYERTLSVAKKTFATRWRSPGSADAIHLLEQMEPFALIVERDQTTRPHTCPACGSKGRALYDISRGPVQIDDSDRPHSVAYFVETFGLPNAFHCAICDLWLDSPEDLELAAVNDIDLGEADAEYWEVDAFEGPDDDRLPGWED